MQNISHQRGGRSGRGVTAHGSNPQSRLGNQKQLAGLKTDDARLQIEQTLDWLATEFAALVDPLGAEAQGPRGLARLLNADAAMCQRLLSGIRARGGIGERVSAWPGLNGVRALADRLIAVAPPNASRSAVDAAIEAYARVIRDAGGSHASLVRYARTLDTSTTGHAAEESARHGTACRGLTRSASELLGYQVGLVVCISVIRPIPGNPELIEGCMASGFIGLTSTGGRVCITTRGVQMRSSASAVAGEVRWTPLGRSIDGRDGLLTDFCSDEAPLTAYDTGDGCIRQMVDLDVLRRRGSVDVVMGRAWSPDSNPQYTSDLVWSHVLRIRHPSRRMLLDGYLHKSMLAGTPPEAGAYTWHPGLPSDPRRNWQDKFPVRCALQVIPASPEPAIADAWNRQAELTDTLFDLAGWDRRDFVGYRCDERSPVWSAAYYMTFDMAKRE